MSMPRITGTPLGLTLTESIVLLSAYQSALFKIGQSLTTTSLAIPESMERKRTPPFAPVGTRTRVEPSGERPQLSKLADFATTRPLPLLRSRRVERLD